MEVQSIQMTEITKDLWPSHIAASLKIEPVEGSDGPWVSIGGTTIIEWFEAVADRLEIRSPGTTKSERMRKLLSFVGVDWDVKRHSSDETTSQGGGNIRREAFEDFFAGLRRKGVVSDGQPLYGRPPAWSWDEQLLAFDLYLAAGCQDHTHHLVRKLSGLLRATNIHEGHSGNPSFRSPSSVARKLSDIHTHRPGYEGKPTTGSKLDKAIWSEFGHISDQNRVPQIANDIRRSLIDRFPVVEDEDDIETVHNEGVVRYRMHRLFERDKKLRERKLAQDRKANGGKLICAACGLNPATQYGERFAEVLECHHLIPLHQSGPRETSLKDVALLCPTCHRVAHRMAPSPTLEMLKEVATPQQRRPDKP